MAGPRFPQTSFGPTPSSAPRLLPRRAGGRDRGTPRLKLSGPKETLADQALEPLKGNEEIVKDHLW